MGIAENYFYLVLFDCLWFILKARIVVSWEKETEDEKNFLFCFSHCYGDRFFCGICLHPKRNR